MLRLLLMKLDKAADADADVTRVNERPGYNVSQIQHANDNENTHDIIVDHVCLCIIVASISISYLAICSLRQKCNNFSSVCLDLFVG